MNYSTAVFLINPNVRAVSCTYEPDVDGKPKMTRTVFKTLDDTIAVGDLVIVPTDTRHKMTVVKVIAVDVDVHHDTFHDDMEWIIHSVDRRDYDKTKADEGRAIKMIRDAEKTHMQNELREKMLAHVDQAQLGALSIAQLAKPTE